MAKSLRSKWRRKCRAVKRKRYGQKELDRLKKQLGIDDSKPKDVVMKEIAEIATVKKPKSIVATTSKSQEQVSVPEPEPMDDGKVKRKYNKRTMRDQFGNYPIWMSQKKIQKKKKMKKSKQKRK